MPYIPEERRKLIVRHIVSASDHIHSPGDLNYSISELMLTYLKCRTDENYAAYNEIVGVLECAKQEFYRRAVAAYEDEAIEKHGDIFDV